MNTTYVPPSAGLLSLLLIVGCSTSSNVSTCAHAQVHDNHAAQPFEVPSALREDHELLHEELAAAMSAGGETAEAARILAERLHGHFVEEDTIALPPLGLLQALAEGQVTPDMAPAIEMGRQVEARLDRYLSEHQQILNALDTLEVAARAENKPTQLAFARRLRLHAATEEQVLYPATILIGKYIEGQLREGGGNP